MSQVHVINHPMIQHKLTIMRDKETGSKDFRQLLEEISLLMGYEVTRDRPLEDKEIEKIIKSKDLEELSEKGNSLINAANNHGGKDNIGIVLVRYTEDAAD